MDGVKFYNNLTTEEFIDVMILNLDECQKTVEESIENNHKEGKDSINEAFANLRLESMKDILFFIRKHKTMTEKEMNQFICNKILKEI